MELWQEIAGALINERDAAKASELAAELDRAIETKLQGIRKSSTKTKMKKLSLIFSPTAGPPFHRPNRHRGNRCPIS